MKVTRHNGRSGKHGVYNPKHNDRQFDVAKSEHIDAARSSGNINWDYQREYRFPEEDGPDGISFEDGVTHSLSYMLIIVCSLLSTDVTNPQSELLSVRSLYSTLYFAQGNCSKLRIFIPLFS